MKGLALLVMKGRVQAIMSVTVLSLLSLIFAPLSLLGGAAVALVTLRHGSKDGLLVVAGSTAAAGVLSYLIFKDILPALLFALALWLPVWLLALLLRFTRSMALALQAGMLMGLLVITYFYLLVGDPAAMWAGILKEPLKVFLENNAALDGSLSFDELLISVSRWMTAIMAAGFVMQVAIMLFIARWWQALLFNPGGFGEEFRALSFHKGLVFIAVPVLLLVLLSQPPEWVIALSLIVMVAYFIQGLAVTHCLLKSMNANIVWIVGIYVLLVIAMPYVMSALAMTGLTDAWMDFRRKTRTASSED